MHYSRHCLTALVVYVTTLTYAPTNDQWARSACPLVSLSESKLSVQFSSVTSLCMRSNPRVQSSVTKRMSAFDRQSSSSISVVADAVADRMYTYFMGSDYLCS